MSTIQGNWYYRRTGTLYRFLPWTEVSSHLIPPLQETQFLVSFMLFTFIISYSCYHNSLYICQSDLSVIQDSNDICRSSSSYFTQELWHLVCDRSIIYIYSPPLFVGKVTHCDTSTKVLHYPVWLAGINTRVEAWAQHSLPLLLLSATKWQPDGKLLLRNSWLASANI